MMGFGMMGGFGLIGMLLSLVVLVGIVVLVVWVVNRLSNGSTNSNQVTSNQSPREIVQARYARGELTREQYQQMLNDLG